MNKQIIYFIFFGVGSLLFTSLFTNCMPSGFITSELSSDEAAPALLDTPLQAPLITLNLMSANQILQSLLNLNDLATDTNPIRTEFNLRRSAFSDEGSQNGINAPYLLSITSLAGTVCSQSITDKKGIFSDLNLSLTIAQLTDQLYIEKTKQLFLLVTQKEMDSEEENLFIDFKNSFLAEGQADSAAQHRQLWVSTCSAIMSHLKTFTY